MSSIFVKLIGRSRVARFAFTISLSTSVNGEQIVMNLRIRLIFGEREKGILVIYVVVLQRKLESFKYKILR